MIRRSSQRILRKIRDRHLEVTVGIEIRHSADRDVDDNIIADFQERLRPARHILRAQFDFAPIEPVQPDEFARNPDVWERQASEGILLMTRS